MTPLIIWFGVATVALISTVLWAIASRETAVYITSSVSFVSWAWLGLTGGDVAMVAETGTIWVRDSLASIQFVAVALAVISLVVFILRMMGAYPAPETNAADKSDTNRSTNNQ